MRKVNLISCELEELIDQNGFRARATALRSALGSERIGAGAYEMAAGEVNWPYHFHTGIEELMYVISGMPVLRDGGGQRQLTPGDFVAFPSGPEGVHTVAGPGRVVIFSTGGEPFFAAYPDSGKFSSPFGVFRSQDRSDYWDGEGTGEPSGPVTVRPLISEPVAARPVVNGFEVATEAFSTAEPAGFRLRRTQLGPRLGAQMLGVTVYELDPGEGTAPYHYEFGREEWLIVLAGVPTLRHPDGQDLMEPGDVVCFAQGPGGAHRLLNRSAQLARVALLSTKTLPVCAVHPDSGKVLFYNSKDDGYIFRLGDQVDYWDGETPTEAR